MKMIDTQVLRAAQRHIKETGKAPKLIGLHPADLARVGKERGIEGDVSAMWGVMVVPCPDTDEGTVEILKP